MKKTISILVLIVIAASCVFAGTHSVKASITPYAFLGISSPEKSIKGIHNSYALGGNLGYEYKFDNNFIAGFDTKVKTNWFKDRTKNLTDIMFMAKAGYVFNLKDVDLYANGEYGVGLQCFDGETSVLMPFGIEVGCTYGFTENWSAFGSLENLYAFSKENKVKFSNISLNTNLGVEYKF